MIDFGSLKSPLGDAELIFSMKRNLDKSIKSYREGKNAQKENNFATYILKLEEELKEMGLVSKQTRVKTVRLIGNLKSFESQLETSKKVFNKKLKTEKRQDVTAVINKSINDMNSYLYEIKRIKKQLRKDSRISINEEVKIHRFI